LSRALLNGCELFYEVAGKAGAPALVFAHSLGGSADHWWPQFESFADRYRVVRYDSRGHGRSAAPDSEYTLEQLGRDALALLDHLSLSEVSFCGLSLGGQVGLWLALEAPERVARLALANTAARIGSAEGWQERIELVRAAGLAPVAESAPGRWFSEAFRDLVPAAVERVRATLVQTPAQGYAGCCAALRDADLRGALGRVAARVAVIGGRHDPVTTPAVTAALAGAIRGASYVELDAAHLTNVEQPAAFARALDGLLQKGG
jgi:3-oxoadipate enol-lactonase